MEFKITNAEILPPRTKDKKGKIDYSVLSGVVVTFVTEHNVIKDSKFELIANDKKHYFNASKISIEEDNRLKVELEEIGYWATKFENDKSFDLRNLINSELNLVVDRDQLNKIQEMSCWC